MRAAVYIRVSTEKQHTENQLDQVVQLVRARDLEAIVYQETESAAARRPVFDQMLEDARTGYVRVVAVWALDRLHRSMVGAVNDVLELDRLGVRVLSVREPWLDTAGPVRSLLVAIFGWVAEQERARLIERTRAGLERARRQGKRLGRPGSSPVLLGAAADLVAGGSSVRASARALGLSEAAVRRHLRRKPPAAARPQRHQKPRG